MLKSIKYMGEIVDNGQKKSDFLLRTSLKLVKKLAVGSIKVSGIENIDDIGKSEKLIVASSHITDLDLPISASILVDKLDLTLTGMSLDDSLTNGLVRKLFVAMGGKKHLSPVPYYIDQNGQKKPSAFNPKNFTHILELIENGKKPVIATHCPLKNNQLPMKPGYAVPYLASLSDSLILPVAVKFENNDEKLGMSEHRLHTLLARASVNVSIGRPFKIDKWPGDDKCPNRDQIRNQISFLRIQGRIVLANLVELLN